MGEHRLHTEESECDLRYKFIDSICLNSQSQNGKKDRRWSSVVSEPLEFNTRRFSTIISNYEKTQTSTKVTRELDLQRLST